MCKKSPISFSSRPINMILGASGRPKNVLLLIPSNPLAKADPSLLTQISYFMGRNMSRCSMSWVGSHFVSKQHPEILAQNTAE